MSFWEILVLFAARSENLLRELERLRWGGDLDEDAELGQRIKPLDGFVRLWREGAQAVRTDKQTKRTRVCECMAENAEVVQGKTWRWGI